MVNPFIENVSKIKHSETLKQDTICLADSSDRAVASLLELWVRLLLVAQMYVGCECCVLSGRGLCDGPITCPEESYGFDLLSGYGTYRVRIENII